jgi:hypothetical protein
MKEDFGAVLSASSAYRFFGPSRKTKREAGPIRPLLMYCFRSGAFVAGVGWIILVALASFSVSMDASMTEALGTHVNFLSRMAEGIIITGFGLAILDAIERQRILNSRALSALQSKLAPPQRCAELPLSTPMIAPRGEPLASGSLNGRDYKLYGDGSVEMETILGTRCFASILDAREFVG